MNTHNLVKILKENEQDFEFYPTTSEIIKLIYNDCETGSWLDIGAGNGNFYNKFQEFNKIRDEYNKNKIYDYFIIEKSKLLINELPEEAILVGVDFKNNTIIDKKVDYIFCNPPYSEFKEWMIKILTEANFSKSIYLVIPDRWDKDENILKILEIRDLEVEVIGNDDFLDAERQARAKVDIIKISHKKNNYSQRDDQKDGFDIFLDSLGFNKDEESKYSKDEELKKQLENEIITKKNVIDTLLESYDYELNKLLNNYKILGKLDSSIFAELNIDLYTVKKALKERLKNLKYLYWNMVFDRLDGITSRLITATRQSFLQSLMDRTNIDFNIDNIYAIIDYTLKNCSKYYDEQLKDIYLEMTEPNNINNYKSNQRTFKNDGWRYIDSEGNSIKKTDFTHYSLDYRIVLRSYDLRILSDILVIANNLGFSTFYKIPRFNTWDKSFDNHYQYGQEQGVFSEGECLLKFRYFKNDNVHIKFNKKFIKAFNIEASRLLGWINTKEDILNEMKDITKDDLKFYFKSNINIENINSKTLLLENTNQSMVDY